MHSKFAEYVGPASNIKSPKGLYRYNDCEVAVMEKTLTMSCGTTIDHMEICPNSTIKTTMKNYCMIKKIVAQQKYVLGF